MRVSVDCWGTIIKGSPTFTEKKIELVKNHFPSLAHGFILHCFSETKNTFNDIIENSGGFQPETEVIFRYLLSKLNGEYLNFGFIKLADFINEYQHLAIMYPPIIYSDDTDDYLAKLSQHAKLILSSNTMLIKGSTLDKILYSIGIGKYFSFTGYSDMLGFAKPDKQMYVGSKWHIGDNPLTDGIGATLGGSKPIIINSTNLTIKDAYHIIIGQKG